MMAMFRGCDLALVEGHLAGHAIKIEVWRDTTARPPLADNDRSILAVVTDGEVSSRAPIWSRHDVGALADRIANLAGHPYPQMTELRSGRGESAIHAI
jgi:molybdopterin-guanine dinucleotide biosynthesis protein